jgi:hypothetical protein
MEWSKKNDGRNKDRNKWEASQIECGWIFCRRWFSGRRHGAARHRWNCNNAVDAERAALKEGHNILLAWTPLSFVAKKAVAVTKGAVIP